MGNHQAPQVPHPVSHYLNLCISVVQSQEPSRSLYQMPFPPHVQYPPANRGPPQHQQQIMQQQTYRRQHVPQQRSQYTQRKKSQFDPFPESYNHILPYLINNGLVVLKELNQVPLSYPSGFDPNSRCDFHAGAPVYAMEEIVKNRCRYDYHTSINEHDDFQL